MRVLVFGGTGATGRLFVERARQLLVERGSGVLDGYGEDPVRTVLVLGNRYLELLPQVRQREELAALPGVSDVVEEDHRLRMRVSGSMAPLLRAAGRHELLDFVSREPSLEEAFLAEYGQGAEKETRRGS